MDQERLKQIVKPLLQWYSVNARTLPWRSECPAPEKAYRVWVSEIMLQQTRVEAVKPYYQRFIEALPDAAALAVCEEERLLKLWEGLGYYNRVRNMQKAAQQILTDYGGCIPVQYELLLKLPGIGTYTAGAIASIAFGQAVPAVDGNVLRVLSRILGSELDITRGSVKTLFEKKLAPVVPRDCPGIFNQSMMELGATVCVPNGAPDCIRCPVAAFCLAREKGRQLLLPVKSSVKSRKSEKRTVFVIRDQERAAVRKRPSSGLLAGLYELPNLEGDLSVDDALLQVRHWGFSPIRIRQLPEAKHVFSHIEWHMTGYLVIVEEKETNDMLTEGLQLIETGLTEEKVPIPAAFAAYTRFLSIRLGQEKYKEMEIQDI